MEKQSQIRRVPRADIAERFEAIFKMPLPTGRSFDKVWQDRTSDKNICDTMREIERVWYSTYPEATALDLAKLLSDVLNKRYHMREVSKWAN
jgi:hypothetical protein